MKRTSSRLCRLTTLIFALVLCATNARAFGQWSEIMGWIGTAESVLNGNLGAIPYAGSYITMAQRVMEGDYSAIPYAGSYISMAQDIANGNFGSIPYAGQYLNLASEVAGYTSLEEAGVEMGSFSDALNSVSLEVNFSPTETATGLKVNYYEMTALYKTQYARMRPLSELYPSQDDYNQIVWLNTFVGDVLTQLHPEVASLLQEVDSLKQNLVGFNQTYANLRSKEQKEERERLEREIQEKEKRIGDPVVELFWNIEELEPEELARAGEVVYAVITESSQTPNRPLWRSVFALQIFARYGLELARDDETRETGEKFLKTARDYAEFYYGEEANKPYYAAWLDNLAIRAMFRGDAKIAEETFQQARAVVLNSGASPSSDSVQRELAYVDEYLSRFYLTQFRFVDALKHVKRFATYLQAEEKAVREEKKRKGWVVDVRWIQNAFKGLDPEARKVARDYERNRTLYAEAIANLALAEFFEGRDYDAKLHLEKAQALFAQLTGYFDLMETFEARVPQFHKDATGRVEYVTYPDYKKNSDKDAPTGKPLIIYLNDPRIATQQRASLSEIVKTEETRMRQAEWAFSKQIANHTRLAQIHSRRMDYELAKKELEQSRAMKRKTFDFLRDDERRKTFERNPLYKTVHYYVDAKTGDPFIVDPEKGVVWLKKEEVAERERNREEVWNRIFEFQMVFEKNILAGIKLKRNGDGDFDSAIQTYQENLKTIEENGYGSSFFMIETLRLLAAARLESGDPELLADASAEVERAKEILGEQKDRNSQYEGLLATLSGLIALERGDLASASGDFEIAEERYLEIRASNALWVDLFYGQARLARAQGRAEDALELLDSAIARAREIRRIVSVDDRDRATAFASYYRLYVTKISTIYDALETARESEKLALYADAFNVMEASRAQGFLDIMNSARISLTEGLDPALREKLEAESRKSENALREAKAALSCATRGNAVKEGLADLQRAVDEAQRAVDDAFNAMKRESPAYRRLVERDATRALDFNAVADEFARNQTLVCEYMIGERESFLLAYGRDCKSARLVKLSVDEEQTSVLAKYGVDVDEGDFTGDKLAIIFGLKDGDGLFNFVDGKLSVETAYTLRALWQILFPDDAIRDAVCSPEKGTRTLVVPDGVLSQLPFEMLVVELDSDLRYLLDEETVVFYAPSVSVYRQLCEKEERGRRARRATFTMGAPIYEKNSDFEPLPGTETEVRKVAELSEESGLKCASFLEARATEKNVRAYVSDKKYAHFACHGKVENVGGKLEGRLALTKGAEDDPENDGFLTLAEFFTLDLEGCDCAVLSACETNRGETQNGEGTWTLGRGALVAGAANVIASDWQVSDKSTPVLIGKFFESFLKNDKDYALALREAKRNLKKNPNYNKPYNWAPFVLIGSGR